jgi:hypothetical protein
MQRSKSVIQLYCAVGIVHPTLQRETVYENTNDHRALLIFLLAACGPVPAEQPVTPTAKSAPTSTPVPLSLPTTTATPDPIPIPMSTATEIFPLDNLRMAYIVDGNLYVQDGSNPPKQLSNSGENLYPIFSDDGEKIVFHRGEIKDNDRIFSISADGSHKLALITNDWLTNLGVGTKAGHLAFVPNTHQMLFNSYLCPEDLSLGCTVGLFLADTDTGIIKEIMSPTLSGHLAGYDINSWYGNFSISPGGKLMSVAHAGQIDILDMNGKVIHSSIMNYTPSTPVELYPRVLWLPDSRGLIVAIPAEIDYQGAWASGDPAYTIWRYTFDDNVATQIPLDPSPTWVHPECNDLMSVSPDGNWVVYFTDNFKVYGGNLADGSAQLYLPYVDCTPTYWSSDNIHFIYGRHIIGQPILGSIDTSPASIPGFFLGWIDAKRYIYFPNSSFPNKENIQILVGEIGGGTLVTYQSNASVPTVPPYSESFTFITLDSK